MTQLRTGGRAGGAAVLAAIVLVLAGCMLLPGKFTSSLDIRKDGTFTYAYTGDIYMLMLMSELSDVGGSSADKAPFTARACYGEDGDEKTCSAEELAMQKADWEDARERRAERRQREGESMKAAFGGINPSDPGAGEEIARRLRQQAGWKTVEYKGNGLFLVDFSITGTLDRDFAFPTIERMTTAMPFVQISRRQDGSVRIDAPGFAPAQPETPYAEMTREASSGKLSQVPTVEGRFTITTDGQMLENNAGDGAKANASGTSLSWPVSLTTTMPPSAIIKLTPATTAR